jgi:Family of unknown function (DUF6370)
MIRSTWMTLLALCAVVAFTAGARADDKKEETLKGEVCCAKCKLGIADECATVVKVGDKVYYFDAAAEKKYHKQICTAAKEGTVTGKVEEKDGKKIVTVSKVEFK